MKLSTKARYGTRALLDLAVHTDDGPVQIRKIAKRQEISERYLWHLLDYLRGAGLVRGVRGSRGGFVLARDPSEIKLSDLLQILEGPIAIVDCVGLEICDRADRCVTREIWSLLNRTFVDVLDSITLADLVERLGVAEKKFGQRAASEKDDPDRVE